MRLSSKSGVKGRGSDRWWERRWWQWWGDNAQDAVNQEETCCVVSLIKTPTSLEICCCNRLHSTSERNVSYL